MTNVFAKSMRQVATVAALGFMAAAAQAEMVSWRISGTVTEASGSEVDGVIGAGDSFSMVLRFDTAAAITNPVACGDGGIGRRCNHGGAAVFFSDISINGHVIASFSSNPPQNGNIIVRNNIANPDPAVVVDGITFAGQDDYEDNGNFRSTAMSLIFRGPENLNVITDARSAPALPPVGLLGLGTRVWQVCDFDQSVGDCDRVLVLGLVESVVAVPEPSTYALMALGLAAAAGVARRRRD